jgi:hypothetical protein
MKEMCQVFISEGNETEADMKEPKQDQANIQLPRTKKLSKPASTRNTEIVLVGNAVHILSSWNQ